MASKINTRFVIIVTLIVATIAVAAAVGTYMFGRRDPGRFVAQGESFFEKGEYRRANGAFGRAYRLEKNNEKRIEIIGRMVDSLERIQPRNTTEARELIFNINGLWRETLVLDPANADAAEKLLGFYYRNATEFSTSVGAWDELYRSANEILRYVEDHPAATLYRGIALTVRASRLGLGEQERQRAAADLERAAELNPANGEIAYYRALLKQIERDRASELGDPDRAEAYAAEAVAVLDEFIEKHPKNVDAWMGRMRLQLSKGLGPNDSERREQVNATLAKLESLLADGSNARLARQVASIIERIDVEAVTLEDGTQVRSGQQRAEQLLRTVVANNPDDVLTAVMLGDNLVKQRRLDEAEAVLAEAKKDRPFPISFEAFTISHHRAVAMKELASIHLLRYGLAETDEAKAEALAAAKQQAEEMSALVTEADIAPALPMMMKGRIALVEGEPRRAEQLLSQANDLYQGRSGEVLLALAQSLIRNGESGAAAEYLSRALATPEGGQNPQVYLQLARLYLAAQQYDQAREVLKKINELMPDNPQVLVLLSQVNLAQSTSGGGPSALVAAASDGSGPSDAVIRQIDASLATIEPALAEGDRSAVVLAARLNLAAGRATAARDLLTKQLESNPADAGLVQQLIQIERQLGNDDQVQQLIARARAAEPDNPVWDVIASTDAAETEELVVDLIEQEQDPITRYLRLHTLYRQTGKDEKADAALASAVNEAPDDARVLMAQLQIALAAKEWDTAERLVTRAEQLEARTDALASGGVWRTNLLQARMNEAVTAEDWAAAEAIVAEAAKLNNGNGLDYAKGNVWRGRLQLSRGQFDAAIRTLEVAAESLPHSSEVRFLLARARLGMGDLAGAEEDLTASLQNRPQNIPAWLLLHQTHDRLRRHNEALTDLRRALNYAPRNRALYMAYVDYLGRHGEREYAVQLRQKIAQAEPDNRANRVGLGALYVEDGQYERARTIFQALLDEDPNDLAAVAAMANLMAQTNDAAGGQTMMRDFVVGLGDEATVREWLFLARFMRQTGDEKAAEAAYRRAVTLEEPQVRAATREMADWLFARQRFDEAAEQYASVLSTLPPDDDARDIVTRRRAESLMRAGQLDEAKAVIGGVLKQSPDDMRGVLLMARITELEEADPNLTDDERQRLGQEADAAYDRAVALSRTNPLAYVQRARRHFESDVPTIQSQVREDLLRAMELDPSSVEPRQMLAQWFIRRGDASAATDELRRLIAARPDYRPARVALVQMHLADDRLVDADTELGDAISRFPNEPLWYQLRALTDLMTGDTAAWERNLAKAYQLDPSDGRFVEHGRAMLLTGKQAQFLAMLRERPEQLQASPLLQAMRAHALVLSRQRDQGVKGFERALAMAVDEPRSLEQVATHMRNALPANEQIALLSKHQRQGDAQVPALILQVRLAGGEVDKVLADAPPVLSTVEPNSQVAVDLNRILAQANYLKSNYDESRRYYDRVLELNPNDVLALNNLAFMLGREEGQIDRALSMAQRAVELTAVTTGITAVVQRANVLDTLGFVQLKAGDLRGAEQTLRRSIRLYPLAANHAHLAEVLIAQARVSDARQVLKRAKELMQDQTGSDVRKTIEELSRSLEQTAVSAER